MTLKGYLMAEAFEDLFFLKDTVLCTALNLSLGSSSLSNQETKKCFEWITTNVAVIDIIIILCVIMLYRFLGDMLFYLGV